MNPSAASDRALPGTRVPAAPFGHVKAAAITGGGQELDVLAAPISQVPA